MKYHGFHFWLFSGQMKHVPAEQYGREYARDIMKRSKPAYRDLVKQAPNIGNGNPMAYSGPLRQTALDRTFPPWYYNIVI